MIESDKNVHDPEWISRKTQLTVNLGLFFNVILAVFKTVFGIIGHSAALLADGINSTSDVIYYIAVKIFLKVADKPADDEHPYGHRQMESIASIVIAAFVITTGIAIFWNSMDSIYDYIINPVNESHTAIYTLYIALFTLLAKIFLTCFTKILGKKLKNPAVIALASDHLNDIFAAVGVIIGILFSRMGYPWVDPLAGALVAIFILKTGVEILKDGASSLMDIAPTDEIVDEVLRQSELITEIKDIESIYSHRFGPYYTLNIIIALEGNLTMDQGDLIADKFEMSLCRDNYFLKQVFIHYHPFKKN